jgi:hypothetical protein
VQQLTSQRQFRELLDMGLLVDAATSALQDDGVDNNQDIYKTCFSILYKACLLAPSSVAPHTTAMLPALQRHLSLNSLNPNVKWEV